MRRGALSGVSSDTAPSHVIVLASADALAPPPRLRLRRGSAGEPTGAGSEYATRVTIIDVASPLDQAAAAAWLAGAGEAELEAHLGVLNTVLYAHRVAAADPQLPMLERRQALAARLGVGAGEEVADGRYSQVRELPWQAPRRPRRRMLTPDGRLAAILTGRDRPLVCEELALRARADLDHERSRHAALQMLVALDAAIAELGSDPELADRVQELRTFRDPVGAAAQASLRGEPDAEGLAAVAGALARVEAALRARAAAQR